MLAPKGLEDASFDLTSNEHGIILHRMAKDAPLQRDQTVRLGTLDHDVTGIEIIRYVAPVILIKATTKDGRPVPKFKATVNDTTPKQAGNGGQFVLGDDTYSDVSLEGPQEDGRYRTSQLPPDTEVEVTAKAEGFQPASRKLTLPEGKTEEVTLILEPVAGAGPAPVAPPDQARQGREWVGHVVDKSSGQPIAGAHVVVEIMSSRDKRKDWMSEHRDVVVTTPVDGSYRFTLTPEEAADHFLYLNLIVTEADHVRYYGGSSYTMTLKNIELGERPSFETIKLAPARAISGVILTPDGMPAAEVKVIAYSGPVVQPPAWADGSLAEVWTDAEGRFRLPIHVVGPAVFWILPEQFEPMERALQADQRGDLGTFRLAVGIRLGGRVIDQEGKPVSGIHVEAVNTSRANQPGGRVLSAANHIRRSTVTRDDGTFVFAPLPPGKIKINPSENGWDPSNRQGAGNSGFRPLSAVFLSQKLKVEVGAEPSPVVIQAVPQVEITAQVSDSKGAKKGASETWLRGRYNGESWDTQVKPTRDGFYKIIAPKGLENAEFDLIVDKYGTMMSRISQDAPLSHTRRLGLGTLDHDIHDIEIIRYVSPIILIRATTRDRQAIPGFKTTVNYTHPEPSDDQRTRRRDGTHSDVSLEGPQEDGRYRTSHLPPDTEVQVRVTADGFQPTSGKLTLPEGKTEEVAFVLDPK